MYPNFSWMRGMWDKFNSTMWEKDPRYHWSNTSHVKSTVQQFCERCPDLWLKCFTNVKNKKKSYRNSQTQPPPIFANLVLSKRVLGAARTIQGEMYKTGMFCQNRCHLRLSSIFKKIIRLDPGGSRPSIRHEPTESPPRLNKTAFTPVRNLVVVTERLLPPAKAGRKREGCLIGMSNSPTTDFTPPKKNGY